MIDWDKYFKEKNERKRWDMLQKWDRLSYDHVDNLLFDLKKYLEKKTEPVYCPEDDFDENLIIGEVKNDETS